MATVPILLLYLQQFTERICFPHCVLLLDHGQLPGLTVWESLVPVLHTVPRKGG